MLTFTPDNLPYKAKDGNMSMNDKPHTPYDAAPMDTPRASEPMVTYGHVAVTESSLYHPTSHEMEVIMQSKKDFAEGRSYTQEEVDKMVEEWQQPLTMEQVNRWNEEAEEADEADAMDAFVPHEAVAARMARWMDSL